MNSDLKITVVQKNLVWENAVQNRINIERDIKSMTEETDVIVLPEMFTTGFSMHPEKLAEPVDGDTTKWMQQMAIEKNSAICGSVIILEGGNYFNRFLFVTPVGHVYSYNKRHLFTLAGEHHEYQSGDEKLIINYKGWRICPLVCYDLRFPVWARNTEDYDLLIYVANWPKPRVNAWDALLKARAIENMTYVVGVNRVGIDPNGHEYVGSSKVYNTLGEDVVSIPLNKEVVVTTTLNLEQQKATRLRFNFLNDKDSFELD